MTSPALLRLLDGVVDLHCHSGPSPYPRRLDHVDAAVDAERLSSRGILVKSHHHSTVTDLLAMHRSLERTRTPVYGGIVLNSHVGGVNPDAVDLAIAQGARAVWFPTVSSDKHIACHDEHVGKFPSAPVPLRTSAVPIVDSSGALTADTVAVLELIAASGTMLATGHLDAARIPPLLGAARDIGVKRLLVNHPEFIVGASVADALEYVRLGAMIEHSLCMYDDRVAARSFEVSDLVKWIEAVGPEHTVLASDLGQIGNPLPVDSILHIAAALLDFSVPEQHVRRMFVDNPAQLLLP